VQLALKLNGWLGILVKYLLLTENRKLFGGGGEQDRCYITGNFAFASYVSIKIKHENCSEVCQGINGEQRNVCICKVFHIEENRPNSISFILALCINRVAVLSASAFQLSMFHNGRKRYSPLACRSHFFAFLAVTN
jgi:hypothetical protein